MPSTRALNPCRRVRLSVPAAPSVRFAGVQMPARPTPTPTLHHTPCCDRSGARHPRHGAGHSHDPIQPSNNPTAPRPLRPAPGRLAASPSTASQTASAPLSISPSATDADQQQRAAAALPLLSETQVLQEAQMTSHRRWQTRPRAVLLTKRSWRPILFIESVLRNHHLVTLKGIDKWLKRMCVVMGI